LGEVGRTTNADKSSPGRFRGDQCCTGGRATVTAQKLGVKSISQKNVQKKWGNYLSLPLQGGEKKTHGQGGVVEQIT